MNLSEKDNNDLEFIEHKWMRYVFYSTDNLPERITNGNGQVFCDLMNILNKDVPGYTCPLCTKDFKIESIHFPDMPIQMTRIRFPKPSMAILCRSIYLVNSLDGKRKFLYTIELTQGGSYLIGGWSPDDIYIIFAPNVPNTADKEAAVIADLFNDADSYENLKLILKKDSIQKA
jgi:hypothetical protein